MAAIGAVFPNAALDGMRGSKILSHGKQRLAPDNLENE